LRKSFSVLWRNRHKNPGGHALKFSAWQKFAPGLGFAKVTKSEAHRLNASLSANHSGAARRPKLRHRWPAASQLDPDPRSTSWLGTIQVLGALFRSSQFQQNETELVVLVTPYLVKPVPPGNQLKTPLDSSLAGNDLDFFLNGRPEAVKTPPAFVNGQGQVQSLAGAIAPGAPGIPPMAGAPVVPTVEPVPPGEGYDPATGYFIYPPGYGGGQRAPRNEIGIGENHSFSWVARRTAFPMVQVI
jgi:hypothetical protein